MARTTDDICMWCESTPCECNKKKPKTPRIRPAKTAVAPKAEPPRVSALEAMRTDARRIPPAPPRKAPKTFALSKEDQELAAAVKVCVTLLGAHFADLADEKQFKAILAEQDTPQFRAYLWKQKIQGGGE